MSLTHAARDQLGILRAEVDDEDGMHVRSVHPANGTRARPAPSHSITHVTTAYALLGVAGAPVFTGTNVGWAFPSFGYILGYLLVAAIAGLAAQRGADRRIVTMAPTAVVSLFSVYILGLAWMIPFAHMTLEQGLMKGFVPFIIGDLLKAAVATGAFPVLRSIFR